MNNIVKKKSLVLSTIAIIIILGLFSLILIGCPKDPPGGGNPCPGNAGCNCGGTNCSYDAPCKCTPKISIDGGSLEVMLAMSEQTIPNWGNFDNQNQDVTVSGSTITVINPVTNILIIKNHNSSDYGKALGAKVAGDTIEIGGITGFSVYSYDGSKWALVKSTTYGPPVLSFTWNSVSQEMSLYSALVGVPSWDDLDGLSSDNTHVKRNGSTVSVDTGKTADILVVTTVDGVRYGEVISSQTAGSYPIAGISGFSSYIVYSKNGGTWFKVGDNYYTPPDPRTNFIADPLLLGLPSKTYATGTGPGSLIDAMETRWGDAQAKGIIKFYPVLDNPTDYVTVAEIENLPCSGIYEQIPEVVFLMKESYFYVWGRNAEPAKDNVSIGFDIAIISTVDGKGWLTSKTEEFLNTYSDRTESYSISSLTDEEYSSVSELGNYNIYIIVRSTTNIHSSGVPDLNLNDYFKTVNVIVVNSY